MVPLPERVVEPTDGGLTELVVDSDGHTDRAPPCGDQLAVEGGQVLASLVQDGQAHQSERDVDLAARRDLEQPS